MSTQIIPQTVRPPGFDAGFRVRLRDLLMWRRDVRRFRTDPLPDGTLEALIELACLAPSVGLSQPWRFVIVEDKAIRAGVRKDFTACNGEALARKAVHAQGSMRSSSLPVSTKRHAISPFLPIARPGRSRARPPHHAGDDRIFGGDGGASRSGLQRAHKASAWAGCRSSIQPTDRITAPRAGRLEVHRLFLSWLSAGRRCDPGA